MPQAINWQQDKQQSNVGGKTRPTYVRIKYVCATRATVQPPFSLPIRIINSRPRRCSQLKLYVNDSQKLISPLQRREHYLLITATSSREVNEGKWEKTYVARPVFCLCCNLELAFLSGYRIISLWKIFFLEKKMFIITLLEKNEKECYDMCT